MNKEELNNKLIYICKKGDLEKVKKLVKDGANIYYKNRYTPFDTASAYGHLDIVKWLYEQGANPIAYDNLAIRWASSNGNLEVVKFLYSIGCSPIVQDNSAIQYASMNGHLDVVKFLYSIGCDPTADDNNAIRNASYRGHLEVVKFLTLVGCDLSKIYNLEMRKITEYYKKYKPIMDKCLSEIYGHPGLERTRTENEISFREYLSK